ncbi:hypothetical protein PI124_g8990 [Phytophthora idaei]|nr:hypothetical protein PI125_g12452 [Phytophthora idaei]KAG3147712.1 hypothetical protein PI126_g12767 [Phytophthora idaei]KAG3246282.1 hypothetical protein PI124_g8990 [Phytophthora idaei]
MSVQRRRGNVRALRLHHSIRMFSLTLLMLQLRSLSRLPHRSVGLLQLATTPRQIHETASSTKLLNGLLIAFYMATEAINTFTTRRAPSSTSLVDIKERNTQLAERACDPSIGLILQR